MLCILASFRLVDLTELIYSQGKTKDRHTCTKYGADTEQLPALSFDYDPILLTIMTIAIVSMQNSKDTHLAWHYCPLLPPYYSKSSRDNLTGGNDVTVGLRQFTLGVRIVDIPQIRIGICTDSGTLKRLEIKSLHHRPTSRLEVGGGPKIATDDT
jgi:hypothetical protein